MRSTIPLRSTNWKRTTWGTSASHHWSQFVLSWILQRTSARKARHLSLYYFLLSKFSNGHDRLSPTKCCVVSLAPTPGRKCPHIWCQARPCKSPMLCEHEHRLAAQAISYFIYIYIFLILYIIMQRYHIIVVYDIMFSYYVKHLYITCGVYSILFVR